MSGPIRDGLPDGRASPARISWLATVPAAQAWAPVWSHLGLDALAASSGRRAQTQLMVGE